MLRLLSIFILLLGVHSLTNSKTNKPRMVFTDKETAVKRLSLPAHHEPLQTLMDELTDVLIAVGQTHLYFYNISNHKQTLVEGKIEWGNCGTKDCSYNITLVHQRAERLFVCGSNGKNTRCCDLNLSAPSTCVPPQKLGHIANSLDKFMTKECEHSVFVESGESADLYVTCPGAQETAGIHKIGSKTVRPANHDKEQHYVGLVVSQGRNEPLQDKVYAFYRQKNKDTGLYSEMWLPFVSQVCMADVGGPKNKLQYSWTSQLNARLFCGDHDSKLHFSELVDVATVHSDQWEDTQVYALFRNEWGMSAVCIYTIGDIDSIFTNSSFKEDKKMQRDRKCVSDSTKISSEVLMKIETASEMELPVEPDSFFHLHHNYTHIKVDASKNNRNSRHTVMFLSLNNGRIHKVVHSKGDFFIIAEYQPFNHISHIHSIIIHPTSRTLYVNSRSEVVQLDVANCAQYGKTCEDCELSRDPDCSWKDHSCTSKPRDPYQDIFNRTRSNCLVTAKPVKDPQSEMVDPQVKHFLRCPMSSHHAQYTWQGPKSSTSCSSSEEQCLLLIDSMGPDQVGLYRCVSEEGDYSKDVVQYQLQLRSTAVGRTVSPAVWVCLIAVLGMVSGVSVQ
ncbi:semaphorin-7A-like [Melanotaenia boesemani]|uniref:semaphorin-7A-like n=1 Tax=Melanotaenia boesemani TaxID=1250792 RepID=UPI001C050DF2|nr:semaphorin-7A-like [Melanotaenia boesemani]